MSDVRPLFQALVLNWGEPEQAPHKREVCAVGLSVRTFMTRKYTRTVLIYTIHCILTSDKLLYVI